MTNMAKKSVGVAILAAGQGTRMNLNVPKPLAPVVGKKLIDFSISEAKNFAADTNLDCQITLVVGHKKELIENHLKNSECKFAVQEKQLGTADALKSYFEGNVEAKKYDYTVVMCADTPLIRSVDLDTLYKKLFEQKLDGVAATFISEIPVGYGRIMHGESEGFSIIEEKDASAAQKKIKEVNSGLYFFKTNYILDHLYSLDSNNKAGEFYLTDLFKVNRSVYPVCFPNEETFIGVNDLVQLEKVERLLTKEKILLLQKNGVRVIDSSSCYIDWDVEIKGGTTIYPNVHLRGNSKIGSDVIIDTGSIIIDSVVDDRVIVKPNSIFENAVVRSDAVIGPFARLRPGANIGSKSKIGNFVEIKKSILSEGVKVSHLSYVGDAEIGENSNIGCGFITCNYDGANKHLTQIGKNCFVGSDSQVVAPISLGDNCFVASGSTLTKSIPNGSFAISRVKQTTKEGMASKFLKVKK